MTDSQFNKIVGWFEQLNNKFKQLDLKIDKKVGDLSDHVDLRFERVYREFDTVKVQITTLSHKLEDYQSSTQTDIKLLKRQVLKIEEEIDHLKTH